MQRHRYVVLDSYRFIAAIGIVIYHFEAHFSPFITHPRDALDRMQSLVDLFFVLSGFVLMHTYGHGLTSFSTYRTFLRKRLARIYPLHAATLAICVALFVIVSVFGIHVRDPSVIDMRLLVPNLLLVQAWGFIDRSGLDSPSWSISAEMFVYLLFPAFVALAGRLRPVPTLVVAASTAAIIEAVRLKAGMTSGAVATFDFGMLRAVPMFLAGIATYDIVQAAPAGRPISWLLPHGLFAAILVLMMVKAPLYLIDALYPLLVGLVALAERGGRPTRLASPALVRLGNASFAIYMLHAFIQIGCVGVIRHTGWTGALELTLVGVAGTVLIVAVGLVSFTLFETPMRRRFSGSARREATPDALRPVVSAPLPGSRTRPTEASDIAAVS